MAETVPAPASPLKEDEVKPTPTSNAANAKKFEGEGLPFKGKLIGMEDLSVDRDEKVCLDAMFKVKAVARARGEHKQRIQLNLTMSAVKVIDDASKSQIALHEIERISFVVIDPRDTRAFGYIYNTSDDRHQFWAIKTERAAAGTVLALKELFELAFEEFTNSEKAKAEVSKPLSTPKSPDLPKPPSEALVAPSTLIETLSVSAAPPAAEPPIPSLIETNIWGDIPVGPVVPSPAPSQSVPVDIWDLETPVNPPVVKAEDPFGNIFNSLTVAPAPPQGKSGVEVDPLFDIFSTPIPAVSAAPTTSFTNNYFPPAQPTFPGPTPMFPPPPQSFMPTLLTPQQPVQQDFLSASPISPVAPPTLTSPFADLGFLGSLSATPAKLTKEAFLPTVPPIKSMIQLQQERRLQAFSRP